MHELSSALCVLDEKNFAGDVTFGNNPAEEEEVWKRSRWSLLNQQLCGSLHTHLQ